MQFWHLLMEGLTSTALLIPIGVFGLFRWAMWLAKRIPAYNEDPALFRLAIESWLANKPDRIIAVVDVTDTACMAIARSYPQIKVIPIDIPGKRPALAAGVDAATTDLVVLVDSDVIWE